MREIFQRELIYFWYFFSIQFRQIAGYWFAGMFLGSLISVFGREKLHALFSSLREKRLGAIGILPAALIGIASPLCMYGTIPIAASFAEKGMEEDWLAAFMMSSILLNPQLLMYSAALGPAALACRFISCLACGITAGLLMRLCPKNKPFFNFSGFAASQNRDTAANPLIRFILNFIRNIRATGPYFLAGVALSALFQRYVPPEVMAGIFGKNRGFGLLMAATVGVPLYVCGGGTIPMLAGWLQTGMSLGQAATFMITGPSFKITNLGALKIIFGIKNFAFYIGFAVFFAIFSGFLVDYVFHFK